MFHFMTRTYNKDMTKELKYKSPATRTSPISGVLRRKRKSVYLQIRKNNKRKEQEKKEMKRKVITPVKKKTKFTDTARRARTPLARVCNIANQNIRTDTNKKQIMRYATRSRKKLEFAS
eukprot:maker-scaffold_16-snap-gene-6.31-mRNA-1 protein AED:0.39 eAED:0.92 QI:42/0/0.5/1/0/0/2/0/118